MRAKKRIWSRYLWLPAVLMLLAGAASVVGTGPGESAVQAAPAAATAGKDEDISEAEIHFLDVGQGDATLIKCGDHAMLIDTGDNDKGTAVQLYLSKQGIQKLDYLVLTHPDADHIGGADVVIGKFTIGRVFMADYEKDNKTYKEVIQALADKKLKWSTPRPGSTYTLGTAKFTILAPVRTYDDPNNSSIALLFQNGGNTFLFTGDGEEEAESDILESGRSVKADVYKAGHHGSDTASSEAFLKAVAPAYAVISCEEGNSYGHPHAAVLNSLRARGVKVFRTDEQGSIIAWSDGSEITWNCAPSDTWQTGERIASASQMLSGDSGQKKQANEAQTGKRAAAADAAAKGLYIGNKNNGKLHRATCKQLPKEENRAVFDTKQEGINAGYDDLCKLCKP